jgi:uncharacterized membrane protein YedE/YeeE
MSVAFQLCFGNLVSIIGINAYSASPAPEYWAGFGVAIGAAGTAIIACSILVFILHRKNHALDQKALEGLDDDFRYCL